MPLAPGTRLGPYEVLALLGAGGMGEVYRARDTRLAREVALKVLPEDLLESDEKKQRFEREAKLLAALNHSGIAAIYSFEEIPGPPSASSAADRHVLAMELIEGRTLAERIAAGPLPEQDVLRLGRQLANALAFAHEHGIVHRDFKSANVVLTPEGLPKVLDFGLARKVDQTDLASATTLSSPPLTGAGDVLGTPAYMAPEQLQGRTADPRSDVWALGIVLYEMAAGRRPFEGQSGFDLASAILTRPPTPLPPGVSARLAAVIERCLAKEPAARYQRGSEVAAALETIPTPPAPRRRRFAAGAGVAAAVLAGFALLLLRRTGSAPQAAPRLAPSLPLRIVVLPFENLGAPEDAYFAAGITDEVASRLASVRGLAVISRTTATQYDRRGKTVAQIGKDLGVGYVLEGSVRWDKSAGAGRVRITPQLVRAADDTHVWSERYDRTVADIFAIQSDVADGVVRALDLALAPAEAESFRRAPTRDLAAYDLYLKALDLEKNRQRPSALAEQIRLAGAAVARDPDFAEALALLAMARLMNRNMTFDTRDSELELARQEAERAVALRPQTAVTRLALGYYHYYGHRDHESALAEFRRALALQPNSADVHFAAGAVLRRLGRLPEAETEFRAALGSDPRNSTLHYGLGILLVGRREYAEGIRSLEASASLDPRLAIAYTSQAVGHLLWKADIAEARGCLDRASAVPGLEDPFGRVHWLRIRLAGLERDWPEALRLVDRFPSDSYQHDVQFIPKDLMRAEALSGAGRLDKARADFERARRLLAAKVAEAPDDDRLRASFALALAGLGRSEEAEGEAQRALASPLASRDTMRATFRAEELARVYTMTGNAEAAIRTLDGLLAGPSNVSVPLLRADPRWDPIRKHPRFEALLVKYEAPR